MIRFLSNTACALTLLVLFGCAHPISMNPDLAALSSKPGATKIVKPVGYHMPDSLRLLEVTTPGGGGDKVRYFPYRDIEAGLYTALSEVFVNVSKVSNPKDAAALKQSGVVLVITPEVTTTSSSESAFTWPPTLFSVNLVCTVADIDGNVIKTIKVNGEGRAIFDEFKGNFSLSAVRASNDALAKLVIAMRESPEVRK